MNKPEREEVEDKKFLEFGKCREIQGLAICVTVPIYPNTGWFEFRI